MMSEDEITSRIYMIDFRITKFPSFYPGALSFQITGRCFRP